MSGHGSPRPEDRAEHPSRKVAKDSLADTAASVAAFESAWAASPKSAEVEAAEASGKRYW